MDPKLNPKLAQQISQWGSELLQEERKGALRDWTPEIARQLKVEFDTNLEKILHNPYFLGLKDAGTLNGPEENCLYTAHKEDILAIYEENKKRPINLVILIEGIGAGKTTLYAVMTWLEWFRLTTKYDPHQYYGMMRDEVIAFIAMNRSEAQAKRVTLQKVFPKFQTQFNLEYFPPSKRRGQEIWIPRNSTLIFAGTSSAASALGYNIYGGCVDEANSLEVIEGGKRGQSVADTYDAAEEMHNAIAGRQKSRFLNPYTGWLDGMLFMVSSARYPNDYLEKKAREHLKLGSNSHIFVRRRTTWDAKPKYYFSGITVKFDLRTKNVLDSPEEIEQKKLLAQKIMAERSAQNLQSESKAQAA